MRRGRMEIWADILMAVEHETRRRDEPLPTRVRSVANLPHDRFRLHLEAMAARGLVETEPLGITTEGAAFLRVAQTLRDTVDLEGPDPSRSS